MASTTEINCLIALEAGGLGPRCQQGWSLFRPRREDLFQALVLASGTSPTVSAFFVRRRVTPAATFIFTGGLPACMSVSKSPLFMRSGACPSPVWPHPNWSYLRWPYFQIKPHSEILHAYDSKGTPFSSEQPILWPPKLLSFLYIKYIPSIPTSSKVSTHSRISSKSKISFKCHLNQAQVLIHGGAESISICKHTKPDRTLDASKTLWWDRHRAAIPIPERQPSEGKRESRVPSQSESRQGQRPHLSVYFSHPLLIVQLFSGRPFKIVFFKVTSP